MDRRRYPKWVQVVPGYIGFLWLVGCTAYMFYVNVIAGRLTTLGKTVMAGVCLTVVTFAISAIWPLGVADDGAEVPRDFWGFVRGPAPETLYLRAVWHKFRRSIVLLLVGMVWMFAWGVLISSGLAHVPQR